MLLNVGCTWDIEQLYRTIEKNQNTKCSDVKVASLYGSLRREFIDLSSVRPDFRIPKTDIKSFKEYINAANNNGIDIEYTVNAPLVESVEHIFIHEDHYVSLLKMLEDCGVRRFIMANPLLMEIAAKHTKLPIKISTIMAASYISDLKYYKDLNTDAVCINIYKNRNLQFLKMYNKLAESYGISSELVANEFCMFGKSPCSDILRQACYNHSALGGNENKLYNNWPFGRCQQARLEDPSSWLRAPFILPQYMKFYSEMTGIHKFKITGRTNTVEHVDFLIDAYLSENYEGDLLNLYMQPNNDAVRERIDIQIACLEKVHFFDKWFSEDSNFCNYNCCECNWCDKKYKEVICYTDK